MGQIFVAFSEYLNFARSIWKFLKVSRPCIITKSAYREIIWTLCAPTRNRNLMKASAQIILPGICLLWLWFSTKLLKNLWNKQTIKISTSFFNSWNEIALLIHGLFIIRKKISIKRSNKNNEKISCWPESIWTIMGWDCFWQSSLWLYRRHQCFIG